MACVHAGGPVTQSIRLKLANDRAVCGGVVLVLVLGRTVSGDDELICREAVKTKSGRSYVHI